MRPSAAKARPPDVVGGTVILSLGAVFLIGGMRYGTVSPDGQLEPGAMPFFAGCLLVLLGASIAVPAAWPWVRALAAPGSPPPATPSGTESETAVTAAPPPAEPSADGTGAADHDQPPTAVDRPQRALALFALTAAAVAAITWIDIFLVLALLVTSILVFFEKVRLWKAATVAVVLVVACYLIFVVLLRVPLPTVL